MTCSAFHGAPSRARRWALVALLGFAAAGIEAAEPAKASAPAPAASQAAPRVKFTTTLGEFVVELDAEKAPMTVTNFLWYVNSGFYKGTIFHRVISDFVVQGGGMTPDLAEKPTRPAIRPESRNGLHNSRGTIAMARTSDPISANSQFFINVKNNFALNASNAADGVGYTVFGKVVQGMDVIDEMSAVSTGRMDIPKEPIVIKEAVLLK